MFQSILGNSRNLIVLPDTTRLIVWESGAHPKTLTSADLPLITHSDAHLARKFDLAMDPMVLDALDLRAQER
jgi:hypothetical protein